MSAKKIAVFGATGTAGSAVIRELLKDSWDVRAVTRDANSAKADAARAAGASLFVADLDDLRAIDAAVAGMDTVYLSGPSLTNRWDVGQARQGISVVDAAQLAGTGHLIYQSAMTPGAQGVLSVGSKRAIEERIGELDLTWTITRPGLFMDNYLNYFPVQEQDGQLTVAMALPVDRVQGLVSAEDIGRAAAVVAADPTKHAGKAYDLIADLQSFGDMARTIGDAAGRPVTPISIPLDALAQGWPEGVDLYRWLSTREEKDTTDTLTALVGKPLTFRDWVAKYLAPTLPTN